MGKLPGSKRPYNSQMKVIDVRKVKRNNVSNENENSLKTVCNSLCENPFLFNQLDEETKEKLSQNARRLVEYVELKENNGRVKHSLNEYVKNYEEKQKRQKLRHSSTTTTRTKSVLLNHTGNNIIIKNSISRDNLIYSSHIASTESTKMKILPKKVLPKISLSSIQRMASPIMHEPNWIDFIEKSMSVNKFNEDLNKTKVTNFSYIDHKRTEIAAEGMLMLSTPPSSSSSSVGTTTPEKESP